MKSDVRLFRDDDDGYLKWISDHRDGFVLNALRVPRASYLMLHRASCRDISTPTRSNWTTTQYLKCCAHDSEALVGWVVQHVPQATPKDVRRCKRCCP